MTAAFDHDVLILGAGAAGMMCALTAGQRGKRVLLLDHAAKVGEKIRISGGGRCNFTNIHATPQHFLSENPHFCVSALKRYTPQDFCRMVEKHGIAYHEKTLGQLFCDGSSQQIIDMLLAECAAGKVEIRRHAAVASIRKTESGFELETNQGQFTGRALVVATGGKSIPKMGATGFGFEVARQFGLKVTETRAALVPVTFEGAMLDYVQGLAGVAVPVATARMGKTEFREAVLFTHRGMSGPAILQISSYWKEGEAISLDLLPDEDLSALLKAAKQGNPKQEPATVLAQHLPKRLAQRKVADEGMEGARLADLSHAALQKLADRVQRWELYPNGTEGYRTAEVTLGGVDTSGLSSQTMESKQVPGLYFIGEVVDVTGHLGGFNFQWAWASGRASGQSV
ncbi:aminoacetone oxidase family FAD-binding enzyme [bacterium]|nr:aminoacetone oxidase family FAD-binding enzyme [bacterium]